MTESVGYYRNRLVEHAAHRFEMSDKNTIAFRVGSTEPQEVLRIQVDGSILWKGREVETDGEFRAAMLDLSKWFSGDQQREIELQREVEELRAHVAVLLEGLNIIRNESDSYTAEGLAMLADKYASVCQAQSLQSVKAGVEEEVIERCILKAGKYHQDMSGPAFSKVIRKMPRKYKGE